MKNKIYPFLLGLSCIVIVALVSFKNSEKVVEKEQMTIVAAGFVKNFEISEIFVSTINKDEHFICEKTSSEFAFSHVLKKVGEYEKQGWNVVSSNQEIGAIRFTLYYYLEKNKQ